MKKFMFGFMEVPFDMTKGIMERMLKEAVKDNGVLIHYDLIDIMLKPEYAEEVKRIKSSDPAPKQLKGDWFAPKPSRWQRFKRRIFGPPSVVIKGDVYGFKKSDL